MATEVPDTSGSQSGDEVINPTEFQFPHNLIRVYGRSPLNEPVTCWVCCSNQ
ncbi:hypothetical protein CROQUDRAFT_101087 [Cronartium quercuum f. sp. fusiforme G11]|uniref:Uncharacterized protein n=1 Tax=Cronartium quercuum f. sp. fusiforme G11 TaxID=708437 RepID=A0A9P6N5M9_9BASI|nr:hypothetical protein CROQUDRAFT_101087 [Cronartium quercuum f. sp. fusiforme G11]